jgi:hypothetical protein
MCGREGIPIPILPPSTIRPSISCGVKRDLSRSNSQHLDGGKNAWLARTPSKESTELYSMTQSSLLSEMTLYPDG